MNNKNYYDIPVFMIVWMISLSITLLAILACCAMGLRTLYTLTSVDQETDILVVETTPTPSEFEAVESAEEPENEIDILADYEEEIVALAKTVYGEARGCSKTQQSAVCWTILNRVDNDEGYFPDDIIGVITQPNQFYGYMPSYPTVDDFGNDICELIRDILTRWLNEKETGEVDPGRTLPNNYLYFRGNGSINIFRDEYQGGDTWDWSWGNPYGEEV